MRTSALARIARVVLACLCLASLGLNPARAQNTSPTVSLSVNYTPGVATTSVSLTATASDPDGSVIKVEFFQNGSLIATQTAPPYSHGMTGVTTGSYEFSVRATDNGGATASASVQIVVDAKPSVSFTSPASGAVLSPGSHALAASASDSDGTVSKVEFFQGTTLIGTATNPPYGVTWTNTTQGTYTLIAKATDNLGVSAQQSISVSVNTPPVVALTGPADGASFPTAPASVSLTASASDPGGSISKVEFYNGATLLRRDTIAPYSYSWTSVAAGTYTLTAQATDNNGSVTTSSPATITVGPQNVAPTVSLTAPANGSSHGTPGSISLAAAASDSDSDSDGTIAKVEFFDGAALIATDTTSPYGFSWVNPAAGSHSITAKATDNAGATATSAAATITVTTNSPPTVSLTSPANGTSVAAGATVTLAATAADSDGSVAKVEFFDGATLLATATSAPYGYAWAAPAAGTHSITARATDSGGASTTSSAATITVAANTPPTVSLTAPVHGATLNASSGVAFSATASDSDGSIAKVEFLDGTTVVGTVTAAPYTYTWALPPSGGHSVSARATDNLGAATTSAPATISVNGAPTVGLSSTTNQDYAPANITLTATASDADGSVAKVEFFNGATLLGTDTTAPYSFVMSNAQAGTYNFTARATDNVGATATTPVMAITILMATPCSAASLLRPTRIPGRMSPRAPTA